MELMFRRKTHTKIYGEFFKEYSRRRDTRVKSQFVDEILKKSLQVFVRICGGHPKQIFGETHVEVSTTGSEFFKELLLKISKKKLLYQSTIGISEQTFWRF